MTRIIDMHCHLFNLRKDYVNPKYLNSARARVSLFGLGLMEGLEALGIKPQKALEWVNETYAKKLIRDVEDSSITHSVLLPMDGAYGEKGLLDMERTPFCVDNDTVIETAKRSDKFLPAGSVNPLRRDWKDELDKCIDADVALIKWLPNTMGFDPADKKIVPFYEKLIDSNIPLLTHVGFEFAVENIDPAYSDLERLTLPLDMGVRVIAAHCGGGRPFIDDAADFEHLLSALYKYPNLYVDNSGMLSIHRKQRLVRSMKNPITRDRMVQGSDYPVPMVRMIFKKELGKEKYAVHQDNPFEIDLEIKEVLGITDEILARGYDIINPKTLL